MWNRRDIKARGKAAFRANYWRCVLVALVVAFVLGSSAASNSNGVRESVEEYESRDFAETISYEAASLSGAAAYDSAGVSNIADRALHVLSAAVEDGVSRAVPLRSESNGVAGILLLIVILFVIAGVFLVSVAAFVVVDVFLLNPLEVGCRRFFLVNTGEPASLREVAAGFERRYLNVVKTTLLRDLYLFLWGLLFVIPGLIKAYSYRFVSYILAEYPDMPANEAITLSRTLMDGNKWKAFMLDLSFLGWNLLALCTLGISGVLYSNPYQCAANAELYRTIRDAQNPGWNPQSPQNPGWNPQSPQNPGWNPENANADSTEKRLGPTVNGLTEEDWRRDL